MNFEILFLTNIQSDFEKKMFNKYYSIHFIIFILIDILFYYTKTRIKKN